jgi:predicted SPOUT superfamily RNA methylase MTH1
LRTPHHPLSGKNKDLKVGEYREGLVLSKAKEGLLLDIGVERPAILRETQFSIDDRLTVQIINLGERTEVQTANREDIPVYWGYTVQTEKRPIVQMVNESEYDLTIATAKLGDKFENKASSIQQKWNQSRNVLVAFGAPSRGLKEIAQQEGTRLWDVFDFVVNMIPDQGTATVRTEEALFASLAILNVQFNH